MKKKGFTLVELMGVIIVLGLISLLIAPTIINQIRNSKQKIDNVTQKLIYSAVDLYLDSNKSEFPKNNGVTYCITLEDLVNDGKLTSPVIDSNGNEISLDKVIAVNVKNNIYNYSFSNSCESQSSDGENTDKTLAGLAVVSPELEVDSIPTCATSGTCEAGTAFAIKVNDTETYKFYVLNDSNNKVTLMMATNLYADGDTTNPNVAWISGADYVAAGGQGGENLPRDDTRFGPITALRILKERTSDWTNITEYSYELDYGTLTDFDGSTFEGKYSGEQVQNVRARLPKLADLTAPEIGCTESEGMGNTTCPSWILEGFIEHGDDNTFGYWLSDASYIGSEGAMYVRDDYRIGAGDTVDVSYDDYFGVRPVITLSK